MSTDAHRTATVRRGTSESTVEVTVDLDGTGRGDVSTGVPFYDHMLLSLAKHSLIDLTVRATGDTEVDAHHTVEDVAIVLGQAVRQALGDKTGIARFGDATVPLDEALVLAVVDVAGRPYCVHEGEPAGQEHVVIGGHYIGSLTRHVLESFAFHAQIALHVRVLARPRPAPRRRGPVQGARAGPARRRGPRPPGRGRPEREGRALARGCRPADGCRARARARAPVADAGGAVAAPRPRVGHRRAARAVDRDHPRRRPRPQRGALRRRARGARRAPDAGRGRVPRSGSSTSTAAPPSPCTRAGCAASTSGSCGSRGAASSRRPTCPGCGCPCCSPRPGRPAGSARRPWPRCCARARHAHRPPRHRPRPARPARQGPPPARRLPRRHRRRAVEPRGAGLRPARRRGVLAPRGDRAPRRGRPPVSARRRRPRLRQRQRPQCRARARARGGLGHPDRRPRGGARGRRAVRPRRRQLPRVHGRARRGRRPPPHRHPARRRASGPRRVRRDAGALRGVHRAEPDADRRRGASGPGTSRGCWRPVVPHMGWSTVEVPERSVLFDGIRDERFYFVHSYAAHTWDLPEPDGPFAAVAPSVTWATHGERFVAAVENGPAGRHPVPPGEVRRGRARPPAQLGPLPLTRCAPAHRPIGHLRYGWTGDAPAVARQTGGDPRRVPGGCPSDHLSTRPRSPTTGGPPP